LRSTEVVISPECFNLYSKETIKHVGWTISMLSYTTVQNLVQAEGLGINVPLQHSIPEVPENGEKKKKKNLNVIRWEYTFHSSPFMSKLYSLIFTIFVL